MAAAVGRVAFPVHLEPLAHEAEALHLHRRLPFTIGTDKHASYPEAFAASVQEKILPRDCKLRRDKYLNNVIEQDHRAIHRRWRAAQ